MSSVELLTSVFRVKNIYLLHHVVPHYNNKFFIKKQYTKLSQVNKICARYSDVFQSG